MADPGVSDLEKERLLAEIGVEPSSVMMRRAAPAPTPAPAPVVTVAPIQASLFTALPPPAPLPSGWLTQRHTMAGGILAIVGAAWTSVALGFGDPVAAVMATLTLGAGTAALFRQAPRKQRLKKT